MFEELHPPYSTITVDPPWKYQKNPGEKKGAGYMAEHQYSTMTNEEIRDLPVGELAAPKAHLYVWVTNPGLDGGRFSDVTPFDIVRAWGFTYVTLITWDKLSPGMGFYFRGQTEHVIFAQRGMCGIDADKREPNIIAAKRGRHSSKPDAFMDLVERVSPGPRVELFARAPRFGWDSWGYGYEGA